MSNEINQAQAQNPLMRLIIYVATFFALYYAYNWWADKEDNSSSSSSSGGNCSSSAAKSTLLNDIRNNGIEVISCTLNSADNEKCDYTFSLTYADGSSNLLGVSEENNQWVITAR
jgi:hypothetical protein